ncbi:MAG: polysaccharide biosynthesis/export family protein [Porphyromonadaceae bacterium]|nr:polysaccharide biosynthesis/export family protein [Porphyromonadaceae bacterium]
MKIRNCLFFISVALFTVSCSTTKDIIYFQDLQDVVTGLTSDSSQIVLRPGDKISIIVNSKDYQLADLFNLPIVTHRVGQNESSSLSQSQQVSSYTVDSLGYIDFPILGSVYVEGMTRGGVAASIKQELISQNLVKDPVVTVEFANLCFFALGEVSKPGRYNIDRDRITVLDALSLAGDLTIYGRRDGIVVLREDGGVRQAYRVDLRSVEQLFNSPVYYLRQNDVVYVEPNPVRARQSTVNGNNVRSTSFWISLASLLTSVGVLVSNLID